MTTDLPQLQQAVRQVPGVATAVVRWPDPLGPASLRVEFESGADRQAVAETVVRTMVEVGGIDLATMQVESEPGRPLREGRPVFTSLLLDRRGTELHIEVTLATRAAEHVGTVEVDGGEEDLLLLVARATAEAINDFAPGPDYRIGRIDRRGDVGAPDEQVTVQVQAADDRLLLGAALVRLDPREAIVRATLDAVNRDVIRLPA